MPRYIDAERVPTDKFWEGMTDKEKAKVLAWFLSAPTVDVVKVVRCEGCQHWNNGYCCGIPIVGDDASYVGTEETDYCSFGIAKIEGEE